MQNSTIKHDNLVKTCTLKAYLVMKRLKVLTNKNYNHFQNGKLKTVLLVGCFIKNSTKY